MTGMGTAYLLNSLWMLSAFAEQRRFQRACHDVEQSQLRLLLKLLRSNQYSQFGRVHHFDQIRNALDFRNRLPIHSYADFGPHIERIADGQLNVLTSDPVLLLEPTSGSTSGRKLIPYTASLRREFQRGISTWISDLFARRPDVRDGRHFWSISPQLGDREFSSGGLPIGFDDDSNYLGGLASLAARRILAVPPNALSQLKGDRFRDSLLLCLLATDDLTLISIWSPTYLTTLLKELWEDPERYCHELGTIATTSRKQAVAEILLSEAPSAEKTFRLWPKLAVISCWADGSAALYVPQLAELFPHVELQPKGLLSTEAFTSVPLINCVGGALSIRSHFFEFLPSGESQTRLAHELEVGHQYRVIVTTGGGLYRYDTCDLVQVVGLFQQCPLLRFLGREKSSDLVGEKLDDAFVQGVFKELLSQLSMKVSFATLVPDQTRRRYHLLLQVQSLGQIDSKDLASRLNVLLSSNPYYRQAIENKQLQSAEVHLFGTGQPVLWDHYASSCVSRGIRWGDIKPTALDLHTNWEYLLNAPRFDTVMPSPSADEPFF